MQQSLKVQWWQWPNILAIDAALVGVGWLILMGDALWIRPLVFYPSIVLGLSIWLVYTTDRWFDVRKMDIENIPTTRHRFVKKHANILKWIWKFVLFTAVFLAFNSLSITQIIGGFVILSFALLHTWLTIRRYFSLPFKEVMIGLVFGSSIFVFVSGYDLTWKFGNLPSAIPPGTMVLLIASALFGLLCFANCALIAERERDIDQKLGRSSVALKFPRKRILWAGLAVLAGLLGCMTLPSGVWSLNAAFAITGGVLGLLGIMMDYLPPEPFRVLADAAMLTPWLILLFT